MGEMQLPLNAGAVELFIAFVVPGLVSMSIYRLVMPAPQIRWVDALIQGLFYGSLNLILLGPLIGFVLSPNTLQNQPFLAWIAAIAVFLMFPAMWPLLLRAAFRWQWLVRRVQVPYPTPWDFFFDARRPAFVLVHLNDGAMIGGYWGGQSYAGSSPNDGDIYLEAVYDVDEHGHFGTPIPDTRGILLRKDQYIYLELFDVPASRQETGNDRIQAPQRQGGSESNL